MIFINSKKKITFQTTYKEISTMAENKEVISSPDNTNCPDIYLASSNEVINNLIMNDDNQEISFLSLIHI